MRKEFLVFGQPVSDQAEITEIIDTLKSGWWGTGPKTKKFEDEFAKYAQSEHAIGVNSCTSGIHLALSALGVGPGDEVITTPLTFCSTVNVILHAGATPVFADVDIRSWNIDPSEINKKITPRTKAIIPVHLHGRPADMKAIMQIAKRNRLSVIEDAAHAIESVVHNKKVGSIGDATVFSFYVTKNLATAEGGMVTTNKKRLADKIRVMSLHGLSKDAYKRYRDSTFTLYECVTPGFKYNMTDLQASLGIHQLRKIQEHHKNRIRIWNQYNMYFENKNMFIMPSGIPNDSVHGMHLYAVILKPGFLKLTRNQFIQQLLDRKIGAGVHFYPVHLHSYYRKTFGYKKGMFPHAEFIGNNIASLPLTAAMTDQDVQDVTDAIDDIITEYKT